MKSGTMTSVTIVSINFGVNVFDETTKTFNIQSVAILNRVKKYGESPVFYRDISLAYNSEDTLEMLDDDTRVKRLPETANKCQISGENLTGNPVYWDDRFANFNSINPYSWITWNYPYSWIARSYNLKTAYQKYYGTGITDLKTAAQYLQLTPLYQFPTWEQDAELFTKMITAATATESKTLLKKYCDNQFSKLGIILYLYDHFLEHN